MFGTIKKAMVIAAVAGLGAVAPAVASADEWHVNGSTLPVGNTVAAESVASLSFTANVGVPVTTECDVDITVDLFNINSGGGVVAHGQVTQFNVTVSTCTVVGIPNCRVASVSVANLPWTISTSGTRVTINGVNFTNTYARVNPAQPCGLEGSRQITGSVTGDWSNPGTLEFVDEPGLLVGGLLPADVNGIAELEGEGGEVITLL